MSQRDDPPAGAPPPAGPGEPDDEARPADGGDEQAARDDESAPTPFDHPLFIPALLFAFALWFGYDGWLNSDPDMQEHLTFNRVGFAVVVVLLAYTGWRGLQELRESPKREPEPGEARDAAAGTAPERDADAGER